MPTWPDSLPQTPDADGWTGGPQNNRISFQPEIGEPITRRRGSASGHVFQAQFSNLSDAQRAAFEEWFEDDLYDGTLSFTWDDPITGDSHTWMLMDEDPPYQFAAHGGSGLHTLTCRLMRLP